MLVLRRITDAENDEFKRLVDLYREAFPEEERRDIEQLKVLLKEENSMFFNAIEYEGRLAGLLVYWNFGTFYYIEHLAVFAEMRNKKIGQHILDWVREYLKEMCILEVEPAETEMAIRRIHYYQRNGYQILDRQYLQPSYTGEGKPFPLWIMGNGSPESTAVLQKQIEIIKEKVYYRH